MIGWLELCKQYQVQASPEQIIRLARWETAWLYSVIFSAPTAGADCIHPVGFILRSPYLEFTGALSESFLRNAGPLKRLFGTLRPPS